MHQLLDFRADVGRLDSQHREDVWNAIRGLFDQSKQNVLGADVGMVEAASSFARQGQYFVRLIREGLCHWMTSS